MRSIRPIESLHNFQPSRTGVRSILMAAARLNPALFRQLNGLPWLPLAQDVLFIRQPDRRGSAAASIAVIAKARKFA
jgi:hypothetical protein